MAWDGSGNFNRTNGTNSGDETWQDDAAAGTKIRADRHDTHDQDLADGIGACITQNNESKPTANFDPATDSSLDMGDNSLRWQHLYCEGINFPATQVASADANTLDDYEEGTFTPTLQDTSGSDSEGQTYTTQVGKYTKIGNVVFFTLTIDVSDMGTLTSGDQARIANLPFTSAATYTNSIYIGKADGLSIANDDCALTGYIPASSDYILLADWRNPAGPQTFNINHFDTGSMDISGQYFV